MKRLLFGSLFLLVFCSVNAQDFSITIDAERDAFYDGLTNPTDGKIYIPSRAYLRDVNANPPEGGDADLSAIVWSAYDATYLYYYAEITDDIILNNNASSSGSQWSNDKLELKFDPDPTMDDVSAAVLQCGMSALDSAEFMDPGADEPGAVDNFSQDGELTNLEGVDWVAVRGEDFARKVTSTGYVLEFRIPMAYINKGDRQLALPADPGLVFGLAINVADNDETARTDMLQWSAGHADQAWSFPRFLGVVTLLENHKLSYDAMSYNGLIVNDSALAWYYPGSVDVDQLSGTPESFDLLQNYPNPFNPSTSIRYKLDKQDNVSLTIYSVTGQVVKTLISDRVQSAGTYEVKWDATDNSGNKVTSGVYFYRIKYGTTVSTKKMMLMQ